MLAKANKEEERKMKGGTGEKRCAGNRSIDVIDCEERPFSDERQARLKTPSLTEGANPRQFHSAGLP